MYGMLGGFGNYFKAKKSYIDNITFRLHYRTTFALLIISSVLVSAHQFIGDPIQCNVVGVSTDLMNNYCWIHGTFTIPSKLAGRIGTDIPHPGVGPLQNPHSSIDPKDPYLHSLNDPNDPYLEGITEEGDEVRHAWYQWVCFVLIIQATLCYVPHFLWKSMEGGKLKLLIQGLDLPTHADPETMKDRRTLFVNYFTTHFHKHNLYVFKFVFCEMLNLVNILCQIYLMDVFLGGQFSTYGTSVTAIFQLPDENRFDPMAKVFPKVTKCTFHKYGSSGIVENVDALCLLAQNIINEKIYVFLWFWYIILSAWTAFHIVFRLVSIASTFVRVCLLTNRSSNNNKKDVSEVVRKCFYGDWFLLMQLSKHIQPAVFQEIIIDLRNRMDQKLAQYRDD